MTTTADDVPSPWLPVRKPMFILRIAFVLVTCALVLGTCQNGKWEAHLDVPKKGTLIVDLPASAIWNRPANPNHEVFARSFSLPRDELGVAQATVHMKWDWMLLDVLLPLWPVTVLVSLLYVTIRGADSDAFLCVVLHCAVGLTLAASTCLGAWLILGGWGPPVPWLFGSVGLITGGIVGFARVFRL